MVEIPITEATLGFALPVFFIRTERIVERIADCSREELMDLSFFYLGILEEVQGSSERLNDRLESVMGYQESMFTVSPSPHV